MIDLIKRFEGCRLTAYDDGMGIWTIGYGTTKYPDGTLVKQCDEVTQEKAEALLVDYCKREVYPYLEQFEWLSIKQKTALASLIYNQGASFNKSKLCQAIKDKDIGEIYKQWDFGVKNWKTHRGLPKRRATELAMFMEDM